MKFKSDPQIDTDLHRLKDKNRRSKFGGARPVFPPSLLCISLCLCVSSEAGGKIALFNARRPTLDVPVETYRLKIENATYGRIEMSTDGGQRYRLVGRVTEPVTQTTREKATNESGSVWKSERDGVTLLVAAGRTVRLRLQRTGNTSGTGGKNRRLLGLSSTNDNATLETNLIAGVGLLGDLAPTPGSPVKLLNSRGVAETFSNLYKPKEGDVYFVRVSLSDETGNVLSGETITPKVEKLARDYQQNAIAHAKASGRKIVSGNLTLKAALPTHEPDPIAFVTFLIDGEEVSTSNTPPFLYEWDTTKAEPGEHVIEARALNRNARLLTQTRQMVIVKNSGKNSGN